MPSPWCMETLRRPSWWWTKAQQRGLVPGGGEGGRSPWSVVWRKDGLSQRASFLSGMCMRVRAQQGAQPWGKQPRKGSLGAGHRGGSGGVFGGGLGFSQKTHATCQSPQVLLSQIKGWLFRIYRGTLQSLLGFPNRSSSQP